MNYKKYLIGFATVLFATSFAQNTRFILQNKIDKIYSDVKNKCGKDYDLLDAKYKAIATKSQDKKLSKTQEEEYSKQFDALKSSYIKCQDENQPIKIEKLKDLLAKVEQENKKEYTPPKNTLLSVPKPFSQDVIRSKMVNYLAGHPLFESLENTLRLRLTFVLDTDGQTKEASITGTENEEIKLFTLLSFYSASDVFQPKESNGKIVKERYTMPLVFMGIE